MSKGPTFGTSYSNYEKVYLKNNKIPTDKSIPGPGSYKIDEKHSKGISMGLKLESKFGFSTTRNKNPGPGAYATIGTLTNNGK